MCGILGMRRYGATPIEQEQITTLLVELERRGNHATGVAIQHVDGTIHVHKDDEPAWRFTESNRYQKFMEQYCTDDAVIVLGHTRAMTKGSQRIMDNNHPLFVDDCAVVHNGMIYNDDELFKKHGWKRSGQVDSDVIRAILDDKGISKEGIKALGQMRGSAAIAAISVKSPGKLLLARSGSPLVIAATEDMLIWASEKAAIHSAIRPTVERFGLLMEQNYDPTIAWVTMLSDQAYIFGDNPDPTKTIIWRDGFDVCKSYTPPRYNVHENYRKWDSKKQEVIETVVCPNEKCRAILSIPVHLQNEDLWKLHCNKCRTMLAEEPVNQKA